MCIRDSNTGAQNLNGNASNVSDHIHNTSNTGSHTHNVTFTSNAVETRPDNLTVNMFIKIN